MRLASRCASLYEVSADPAADGRRLGVRLHALILDGSVTPLDSLDARLGWHDIEADGDWR